MSRINGAGDVAIASEGSLAASDKDRLETFTQAWADLQKAPTLVLWLEDEIERTTVEHVFAALSQLPPRLEKLWIVLTSGGGSLDGAYHVTRLLQQRADKVCVVVPRWAKSAATLIALGCDEIVMHPLAELGPLDAQVETVRGKQRTMRSTLDAIKSLDYLRTFAVDTFDRAMLLMARKSDADNEACAAMAAKIVEPIVNPIFSQVEPGEMGRYNLLLALAIEYGERLMARPYESIGPVARNRVLKKMVSDYPAHSFVIDLEEAQSLRLRARAPSQPEGELLDRCARYFVDHDLHSLDDRIAVKLPIPGNAAESSMRAEAQPDPTNGTAQPEGSP